MTSWRRLTPSTCRERPTNTPTGVAGSPRRWRICRLPLAGVQRSARSNRNDERERRAIGVRQPGWRRPPETFSAHDSARTLPGSVKRLIYLSGCDEDYPVSGVTGHQPYLLLAVLPG